MKGYIEVIDKRTKYLKDILSKDFLITSIDNCDFAVITNGKEIKELKNKLVFSIKDYSFYNNNIALNDMDSFKQANNQLTVENMLVEIIGYDDISLLDKDVLILGYGHLGKLLCLKLKQLVKSITVANRNYKEYNEIVKKGFSHEDINNLSMNYDLIINTIPANVLDKYDLNKYSLTVFDLASKPYGYSKKSKNYVCLKRLPNWYTSYSAALVMANNIKAVINGD